MAGEEVVKAGCLLLEALRSGRVGIVRDERGEVVDLLVEGRGLLGRVGSVEEASRFFVKWVEPPPLFVVVGFRHNEFNISIQYTCLSCLDVIIHSQFKVPIPSGWV
jgi:hypothetical protein